VRALIAVAANPVLSAPNGPRIARALDGLDFMLSLDIYLNETSRHADVILPGLSPLEDLHYDVAFPQFSYRNHARYSDPVFERTAGMPEEWQTLLRLAALVEGREDWRGDMQALDDAAIAAEVRRFAGDKAEAVLAALAPLRGPQRLIDLALRSGPYGDGFGTNPQGLTLAKVRAAPGGIDLGPLQPRIPELLRTPSGQIELAPPALLAELAAIETALAVPAGGTDELLLIGRRDVRSGNSWMHNLPLLAKGPQRCTLLIHPEDAARHGLAEGALARLSNAQGSLVVPVSLHAALRPGVVSLPHGWGHDLPGSRLALAAERPGVNMNALLDDAQRDPLSGNAVLSGVAVWLEAAAPPSAV